MANAALIEALRAADTVQSGEFEFSYDGTSSYYVDKCLFETDPRCLKLIVEASAERVADDDKLAGVALGAVPLVAATAVETNKPYIIARKKAKEYGTTKRIEGALDEGEEVVVLEDIATTGQDAVDAVEALREAGAVVDCVVVVVDRQKGAAELLVDHDIALESLLTAEDLLADADGWYTLVTNSLGIDNRSIHFCASTRPEA